MERRIAEVLDDERVDAAIDECARIDDGALENRRDVALETRRARSRGRRGRGRLPRRL